MAIGLVDKFKRVDKTPSLENIGRYFRIQAKTIKRAINEDEDEDADEVKQEVGFHQCSIDDMKYFYDLSITQLKAKK